VHILRKVLVYGKKVFIVQNSITCAMYCNYGVAVT
jgi:hypothetical protein